MAEPEIQTPSDLLNKLSVALIQVSRGDPMVALRNELQTQFDAISTRFNGIDKATELQHDDLVRVPTQVDRAISGLRDLLIAEINTSIAKVDGKLATIAAEGSSKFTGAIDVVNEKITSLANVTTQQFKSIDDKFAEKDKAVSVGLSAQKESAAAQQDSNNTATRKMEDNFTKLLDQGRELLTEVRRNTELQINDIKSRLDKGEGKTSVSDPALTETLRMVGHSLEMQASAIRDLKGGEREAVGHAKGADQSWGVMLGAAGILISFGTLIVLLLERSH